MTLLAGVRSLLSRRRGVVDLSEEDDRPSFTLVTDDAGPASIGIVDVEPKLHQEQTDERDDTRLMLERLEGLFESQIESSRRQDDAVRGRIEELASTIGPTLQRLPALERQTEAISAELSGALEPLAAIDKRTAELSVHLTDALAQSAERQTVLRESLARLSESSESHGPTLTRLGEIASGQHETLAQIRQQLAAVTRSVAETGATLADLSETVASLAAETRTSATVMAEMLRRVEHWIVAALVIAGGASLIALFGAGVALFG